VAKIRFLPQFLAIEFLQLLVVKLLLELVALARLFLLLVEVVEIQGHPQHLALLRIVLPLHPRNLRNEGGIASHEGVLDDFSGGDGGREEVAGEHALVGTLCVRGDVPRMWSSISWKLSQW
jgi:hypothetical protein